MEFKATDRLCLDGQRLIPVDASGLGTTHKDSSNVEVGDASGVVASKPYWEYRTEKDSFARVRAYGAAGGAAANGPDSFKVWTKAGQVYEYGTNPNGNASAKIYPFNTTLPTPAPRPEVAVWAVSRISDLSSNYIDFKYVSVTLNRPGV